MVVHRLISNYLGGNILDALQVQTNSFGELLRFWRKRQRISQLDLSLDSGVSAKHISFLETGRAQPSRETILLLTQTLGLNLRDRNTLLMAAGYQSLYGALPLDAPEMTQVNFALEQMLEKNEPFPALTYDRTGNILKTNKAMVRFMTFLLGEHPLQRFPNGYMMFFAEEGLRPYIVNWDEMVAIARVRLREELLAGPAGELPLPPELAKALMVRDDHVQNVTDAPVFYIHFKKGDLRLAVMLVVTSFGTPFDITVQELRLETFFPADEKTRAWFEELALKDQASP